MELRWGDYFGDSVRRKTKVSSKIVYNCKIKIRKKMSETPQNKEAEKVEESLRDFIGRVSLARASNTQISVCYSYGCFKTPIFTV